MFFTPLSASERGWGRGLFKFWCNALFTGYIKNIALQGGKLHTEDVSSINRHRWQNSERRNLNNGKN